MKNLPYIILTLFSLIFLCYCHISNRHVPAPSPDTAAEAPQNYTSPVLTTTPNLTLYASGACLMDASSGRILYGKNESAPLPMASTTKIMTCLLALERANPEDTVTFSQKAASMPKVHLGAGEGKSFRLEELLYSLMLESHNDTAVAIAEHIGGSVEGFAAMMNEKAAELGMSQTTFVTPNGLDSDGHASTPADMCRLAVYACRNENFLSIISTPSRTIHDTSGSHSYSLRNRDAFLTSYEGAIGIKTGFTGKAGYCFVGAAKRDNLTLVSCVLASGWPPNKSYKWTDTKALMNYGFENFFWQGVPVEDLSSYRIRVEDGKSAAVGVTQPQVPEFLLSASDVIEIGYTLPEQIQAPVKKDVAVGEVTISVNSAVVGSFSLYPREDVEKKYYFDFLYDTLQLFFAF